MIKTKARTARKPKAVREAQNRATLVFRDFVRHLEKLGDAPAKRSGGETR
jgi:hypothetical protein